MKNHPYVLIQINCSTFIATTVNVIPLNILRNGRCYLIVAKPEQNVTLKRHKLGFLHFSSIVLFCPRSDNAFCINDEEARTQTHTCTLVVGQQNGALLSHLQLCIFFLTKVKGYSSTGRLGVSGHLLRVPEPLLCL